MNRAILAIASCMTLCAEAVAQDYKVGIARTDITPDGPIWMSGYGSRNKPSEGIDQRLFAKVLVVEDSSETRNVLVTADMIGFPAEFTEALAERVRGEFGVPRERFLLNASHTHTGPVVHHSLGGMFELSEPDSRAVQRHTQKMGELIFAAVGEALGKLEPAQLSFAHGRAGFAANRRMFRPNGVQFGVNPDGARDHDVPVLRIDSANGRPRAIVFGYACHCTTLGGDHFRIGGDWAGYAQEYIELAHPGATAFFVTGCGADSNPEPRGKLDFARQHGSHMAGAVAAVLTGPMTRLSGKVSAAFGRVALPLAEPPSREEFEKKLTDRNVFVQRHARRQLDRLARGEPLPREQRCPVQVWRFGNNLTRIALGGEVCVDYVLRLKRELGADRLWVAGYSNDVFAYVPSVRILIEGGYEADFNLIYYGLPTRFAPAVEETLVKAIHEQVNAAAAK